MSVSEYIKSKKSSVIMDSFDEGRNAGIDEIAKLFDLNLVSDDEDHMVKIVKLFQNFLESAIFDADQV